jgi:hypothetical protein
MSNDDKNPKFNSPLSKFIIPTVKIVLYYVSVDTLNIFFYIKFDVLSFLKIPTINKMTKKIPTLWKRIEKWFLKKNLKNSIFRIAIKFQTIFELGFDWFNFYRDSDKNLFELKYNLKIIS